MEIAFLIQFALVLALLLLQVRVGAVVLANHSYYESFDNGNVTIPMELNEYFYQAQITGQTCDFYTRVYNRPAASGITLPPGPLIYVKAGDNFTIELENGLGGEVQAMSTLNSFHYANYTNIHTHGIHVDAEDPQDNVIKEVLPGASWNYVYNLVHTHAGGTFWYHAHHHGSTTAQVGGGAYGVLIVADAPGDLPDEYWGMNEVVLMLALTEPDNLQGRYLSTTQDHLLGNGANTIPSGLTWISVNGDYQPTGSLESLTWYRFRMVWTSLSDEQEITMTTNTAGCSWQLLAKDGVYVSPAPRTLVDGTLYFAPGNRVDVVLKCTGTGTVVLGSDDYTTMVTFTVTAGTDDAGDLPVFTPYRPNYIADVYNYAGIDTTTITQFGFSQSAGSCVVTVNNAQTVWDKTTMLGTLTVGKVYAFPVSADDKHPFHLHVNSVQLKGVTDSTGWFQEGDWQDVVYRHSGVDFDYYVVPIDRYYTKYVVHCHFLPHEDKGCMGAWEGAGTSGDTTGLVGHSMTCTGVDTAGATYTGDGCTIAASDSDDDAASTLTVGAIIGIAVGSVVVVAGAGVWYYRYTNAASGVATDGVEVKAKKVATADPEAAHADADADADIDIDTHHHHQVDHHHAHHRTKVEKL
jgi:FtsP/CotA-like multicopper oxidase with cupredoxin domain